MGFIRSKEIYGDVPADPADGATRESEGGITLRERVVELVMEVIVAPGRIDGEGRACGEGE